MAKRRLPYFRFYPWDYLNDPVVWAMDADAEGCYIQLLARSWDMPEPGVIPEDMVARLARLERITDAIAPDAGIEACPSWDGDAYRRQSVVLAQIKRAFDTTSRPGCWVQKRVVSEHSECLESHNAKVQAAIDTNAKRNAKRVGKRPQTATHTDSDSDSDSEVRFKKSEADTPPLAIARPPRARKARAPVASLPESESFVRFYETYPKHVDRPDAWKAWIATVGRDEDRALVDAIMGGLEDWTTYWAAEQTERRFIKSPASWLRLKRWMEPPEADEYENGNGEMDQESIRAAMGQCIHRNPGDPEDRAGWCRLNKLRKPPLPVPAGWSE